MKITEDQLDTIRAVLDRWNADTKEIAKVVADQAPFGPIALKGTAPLLAQMEVNLARLEGARMILQILEIQGIVNARSDSSEEAIKSP